MTGIPKQLVSDTVKKLEDEFTDELLEKTVKSGGFKKR